MMETWSSLINFEKVAEKYDSPLYVFYQPQLRQNISDYLELVEEPKNIAFPVKATPTLSVLTFMAKAGLSADCASESEVDLALKAGIPASNLFYNTPDISAELAHSVLLGGGSVVFNDASLLSQLYKDLPDCSGSIYIRWNPAITSEDGDQSAKLTTHGAASSQFGCFEEEILALPKIILDKISGIHTHPGSRIDNIDTFTLLIKKLHSLIDSIAEKSGHLIEQINLGGGLGLSMNQDNECPTIQELNVALCSLKRDKIRYVVEPGNSLTGNTMGLLAKIKHIRVQKNGQRTAILNVGSNQLLKYTLSGIRPEIMTQRNTILSRSGKDKIVGPLCFAGDTISSATELESLKVGDLLFIQHCGAYCISLSNRFNGRYRPPVLTMLSPEKMFLSESKEDLWLNSLDKLYLGWQNDINTLPASVLPKENIELPDTVILEEAFSFGTNTIRFDFFLNGKLNSEEKYRLFKSMIITLLNNLCPEYDLSDFESVLISSENDTDNKNVTLYVFAHELINNKITFFIGNESNSVAIFQAVLRLKD